MSRRALNLPLTLGLLTACLLSACHHDSFTSTVTVPDVPTSDNHVMAATTPSGELAVPLDQAGSITVTFTTDDGALASDLNVTTDLTALPAGWSSPSSTLECNSVAMGGACHLSLSYAPTSSGNGTLSIEFSYSDNSGTPKTGSIDIPYVTVGAKLYAGQHGELQYCAIRGDGALSDCKPTGSVATATGVALHGDFAYIADNAQHDVAVCHVATDGSLSQCAYTGNGYLYGPYVIATQGNHFYVTSSLGFNYIKHCTIESDGSLTGCFESAYFELVDGMVLSNGHAYLTLSYHDLLIVCDQLTDGRLDNCALTGSGFDGPESMAVADGRLLVSNKESASVSTCDIDGTTGALSNCFTSPVGAGPMGIALHEQRAYVSTTHGNIFVCDLGVTGALTNCAVSNGGATFGSMVQLGIQ
jgi:hypothetical protein